MGVEVIVQPPLTLFEKIWRKHSVLEREDGQTLLYVDSHFLQDGSAPAFEMLRRRGIKPRAPERAFATPDHYIPTSGRDLSAIADPEKRAMADALRTDSAAAGIAFFGLDDPRQGIVHVVGARAGAEPARHADRLRRQPHLDATARSARWPSASARPRWRTCWPRRRCGSASRRRCGSGWRASSARPCSAKDVILHLIAHHRRRRAPPATPSNTPARRSRPCRWRAG